MSSAENDYPEQRSNAVPSQPEPKPRPPLEDLYSSAENVLLDFLRQSPQPHFTRRHFTESIYAQTARRRLELWKGDDDSLTPIFAKAAATLNKRLKSFRIEVKKNERRRSANEFTIRLTRGKEWPEALREAWSGVQSPNEYFLSDIGLRILNRLRAGEFPKDFREEATLAFRLGLGTRDQKLGTYVREVAFKSEVGVQWKEKRKESSGRPEYRVWIEANQEWRTSTGLNLGWTRRTVTIRTGSGLIRLWRKAPATPRGSYPSGSGSALALAWTGWGCCR